MSHIPKAEYARRRKALMAQMVPNSIAILPAAAVAIRNRDVEHVYRQDSDFQYLSGFPEPEAVIALIPGREHGEYVLFCRERNPERELWDGLRAGQEGAELAGVQPPAVQRRIDGLAAVLAPGTLVVDHSTVSRTSRLRGAMAMYSRSCATISCEWNSPLSRQSVYEPTISISTPTNQAKRVTNSKPKATSNPSSTGPRVRARAGPLLGAALTPDPRPSR
mgnify:CR=1 FL=1